MFRLAYLAVVFPLFDVKFIGGSNCRVVCVYKWNVIVIGLFVMFEHVGSVYSFCFLPLLKNDLNLVDHE